MDKLNALKKIIYSACLYFTVAIFLILSIANIARLSSVNSFLSLSSTALVFFACIVMSALNLIWKLDYSLGVRTLLHFFGSFATYSIIFVLIPKVYTDPSQIMVRSAVFAIVYLFVAFTVMIVWSIRKNRRSENMEYESQFGNLFDK